MDKHDRQDRQDENLAGLKRYDRTIEDRTIFALRCGAL